MKTSENGLALIRSFEGYHRRLADGRCAAYLCPAGVWTIGFGNTEGIKPGMIWTREEAETNFRSELRQFEEAVNRLVTVEMTQNQYDALVSFAYNCGIGALQRSSVLRHFNAGRDLEAAKAFHLWNKARDPRTRRLRVLRGLVRRRAMEAALFQQPDPEPATAPEPEPEMPQEVLPSPEKPSRPTVAVTSATAAGGAGIVGSLSFAKEISGATSGIAADIKAVAPPISSVAWPGLLLGVAALAIIAVIFKR